MTSKKELKNAQGKIFYTVEYDPDHRWVYANWIGFVTVENVKAGCEAGLQMMKEARCTNLLNDNRELTGPWRDANDWIEQDWMPRALQAGFKNFAHITSPNVFAEYSVKDLETRVEAVDFTLKVFKGAEEARKWLAEQQNVPAA